MLGHESGVRRKYHQGKLKSIINIYKGRPRSIITSHNPSGTHGYSMFWFTGTKDRYTKRGKYTGKLRTLPYL